MRQVSKARGSLRAMAIKVEVTVTMVTVTTRKAVAALTHSELKVCGCLQRVSIHVKAEGCKMETHQCRQGHLSDLQSVHTEMLDVEGDAEESNLYLQKSAKH